MNYLIDLVACVAVLGCLVFAIRKLFRPKQGHDRRSEDDIPGQFPDW